LAEQMVEGVIHLACQFHRIIRERQLASILTDDHLFCAVALCQNMHLDALVLLVVKVSV
jgi:hypothetical protein